MTPTSVPAGFVLALPDDWVTLDLDPETADQSVARLLDLLGAHDQTVAKARDGLRTFLRTIQAEAIADGAELCGVHFDVDREGRPVQATVTVGLRRIEESVDIAEALGADGCDSAKPIRVSQRTDDDFLFLAALVPVPNAPELIAAISLLSPSLTHEGDLRTLFDAMLRTFSFTWDEGEADA